MKKPLIILDRDGVINHDSANYVRSLDEWTPIAGAIQSIVQLTRAGYVVCVATNQAGVPKGFIPACELDAMHDRLRALILAAGGQPPDIFDCRHHPDDQCACRKPRPGLLLQACALHGVSPADAIFVGDSVSDILAARNAGCQAVLVLTGNGAKTLEHPQYPPATPCLPDLAALPAWIQQEFEGMHAPPPQ